MPQRFTITEQPVPAFALSAWKEKNPKSTWNALMEQHGINNCVVCNTRVRRGGAIEVWADDRAVLLYGYCDPCASKSLSAYTATEKLRRVRQNSPLVDASKIEYAEFPFETKQEKQSMPDLALSTIDLLIRQGRQNRDTNRAGELDEQIELYAEVVESHRADIEKIVSESNALSALTQDLITKKRELTEIAAYIDEASVQQGLKVIEERRVETAAKLVTAQEASRDLDKQMRLDQNALSNFRIERAKLPKASEPLRAVPQPEAAEDIGQEKIMALMTKAARCGLTAVSKNWKVAIVGGEAGRASAQKTTERLKTVLQAPAIDWYSGNDIEVLAGRVSSYSIVVWFIRCSSHSKKLMANCRRLGVPCVLMQSWGTEVVLTNMAKTVNIKWE